MKLLAILVTFSMSFSALAYFNEVECNARNAGQELYLEVEQPFPSNSVFRRAVMTITKDGGRRTEYHNVSPRRAGGLNRIQYFGPGLRMEIDLWPDTYPRWGRSYGPKYGAPGQELNIFHSSIALFQTHNSFRHMGLVLTRPFFVSVLTLESFAQTHSLHS